MLLKRLPCAAREIPLVTVRPVSRVALSVRERQATDSIQDLGDFAAPGVVVVTFTVEVATLLVRSTAARAGSAPRLGVLAGPNTRRAVWRVHRHRENRRVRGKAGRAAVQDDLSCAEFTA